MSPDTNRRTPAAATLNTRWYPRLGLLHALAFSFVLRMRAVTIIASKAMSSRFTAGL